MWDRLWVPTPRNLKQKRELWPFGLSELPAGAPSSPGSAYGMGTWVPWRGDPLQGLPGQLLQFGLGIVQAVAFHVLMRGVRQELV